ncbi:MAG: UDP-N-acetylmuramate--L-alanine ligase [Phototrophicales bacterium]|nr:MAG: UDP-N-acetylmuramate--L-alanine ligase [Phototrophicales bacterium]
MRYHVIGIGGFGMSAIARVLAGRGHNVTGSDARANALTAALQHEGIQVYIGHQAQNIHGAEAILASTAIPDDNPELIAAKMANIPIYRRRDILTLLTEGFRTIGIAGTHGKTTTTALATYVLDMGGLDPTAIVGGVMMNYGSNARVGKGEWFVIEADEYGEMFLGLSPEIAVINNIEHDHPDLFPDLTSLTNAFKTYSERILPHGILIGGIDSSAVQPIIEAREWAGLPSITYSLQNSQATWYATNIYRTHLATTCFTAFYNGEQVEEFELNMLGAHNVENALAVIAIAHHVGIDFSVLKKALVSFKGTGRRSEIMGRVRDVLIINDYAHHPTAIRSTLAAWKPVVKRLWAVWEPHTYTRMRALASEFAHAFVDADKVLVVDVYSVREEVTPGLNAPNLARMITETGHPSARYVGDFAATAELLAAEVQRGDGVIILSAGDAPAVGHLLLRSLMDESNP